MAEPDRLAGILGLGGLASPSSTSSEACEACEADGDDQDCEVLSPSEAEESVASSFHESAAPLEAALAEVAADGILEVLEVVNEAAPPAERDSLADVLNVTAFMDAALALDAEEFQLDSPTSPLSLDANSRVSGRVVVVGEGKAGKTSEAMDEKVAERESLLVQEVVKDEVTTEIHADPGQTAEEAQGEEPAAPLKGASGEVQDDVLGDQVAEKPPETDKDNEVCHFPSASQHEPVPPDHRIKSGKLGAKWKAPREVPDSPGTQNLTHLVHIRDLRDPEFRSQRRVDPPLFEKRDVPSYAPKPERKLAGNLETSQDPPHLDGGRPLGAPEVPKVSQEVLWWRTQALEAWENWNGLVAPHLRDPERSHRLTVQSEPSFLQEHRSLQQQIQRGQQWLSEARAARSSGAGPPLHATGDAQTSGAPSTDPSLRPSSSNPPTTSETSQAPRGFRKYLPEAATASVPLLRPVKDESGLGTPRCKRSVSFAAFSSMGASVEEKLHDAREAASKGREIQLEIEANKEPFPIRAILAAKKVAQEAAEAVEEARQRIEQERVEKFVDEAAEQAQQAQHKAAQEATSRLADTMEGIAEDLEVLMPYKIQVDFPHAEQPQSSSSSPSSPCSSPVGTDGSDPQSDLWSNPRSDPRWSQIGAALEAEDDELLDLAELSRPRVASLEGELCRTLHVMEDGQNTSRTDHRDTMEDGPTSDSPDHALLHHSSKTGPAFASKESPAMQLEPVESTVHVETPAMQLEALESKSDEDSSVLELDVCESKSQEERLLMELHALETKRHEESPTPAMQPEAVESKSDEHCLVLEHGVCEQEERLLMELHALETKRHEESPAMQVEPVESTVHVETPAMQLEALESKSDEGSSVLELDVCESKSQEERLLMASPETKRHEENPVMQLEPVESTVHVETPAMQLEALESKLDKDSSVLELDVCESKLLEETAANELERFAWKLQDETLQADLLAPDSKPQEGSPAKPLAPVESDSHAQMELSALESLESKLQEETSQMVLQAPNPQEEILQKELTSKEHQLAEEELNTKAVPEESLRLDSPSATWALRGNVSCALRAQARDGRRGVSRLLGARDSARGAADGGRAVNQSSCLGRSMAAVSPPGKRRLKAHLTSSYVFKERAEEEQILKEILDNHHEESERPAMHRLHPEAGWYSMCEWHLKGHGQRSPNVSPRERTITSRSPSPAKSMFNMAGATESEDVVDSNSATLESLQKMSPRERTMTSRSPSPAKSMFKMAGATESEDFVDESMKMDSSSVHCEELHSTGHDSHELGMRTCHSPKFVFTGPSRPSLRQCGGSEQKAPARASLTRQRALVQRVRPRARVQRVQLPGRSERYRLEGRKAESAEKAAGHVEATFLRRGRALKERFEPRKAPAPRHGLEARRSPNGGHEWPDLCISSCIEGLDGAPALNLGWGACDPMRHHAVSRLELQCMDLGQADRQPLALIPQWHSFKTAGVGKVLYAFGPPTLFTGAEKCVQRCPAHVGSALAPARVYLTGLQLGDAVALRLRAWSREETSWSSFGTVLVILLNGSRVRSEHDDLLSNLRATAHPT